MELLCLLVGNIWPQYYKTASQEFKEFKPGT